MRSISKILSNDRHISQYRFITQVFTGVVNSTTPFSKEIKMKKNKFWNEKSWMSQTAYDVCSFVVFATIIIFTVFLLAVTG